MRHRLAQGLAARGIPQPRGVVIGCGHHPGAVGAEVGRPDSTLMRHRLAQGLAALVPSHSRAVLSCDAVTTRVPSGLNWADQTMP